MRSGNAKKIQIVKEIRHSLLFHRFVEIESEFALTIASFSYLALLPSAFKPSINPISSFPAVILFMIILCLLVMILAMKQNPVCDLSTPHSEALTVNIMGEIRYAREQAKADHR